MSVSTEPLIGPFVKAPDKGCGVWDPGRQSEPDTTTLTTCFRPLSPGLPLVTAGYGILSDHTRRTMAYILKSAKFVTLYRDATFPTFLGFPTFWRFEYEIWKICMSLTYLLSSIFVLIVSYSKVNYRIVFYFSRLFATLRLEAS